MNGDRNDQLFFPIIGISLMLVLMNVYFFAYTFFASIGWKGKAFDQFLGILCTAGLFSSQYKLKLFAVGFCALLAIVRSGKTTAITWPAIACTLGAGVLMYLFPVRWSGEGMYVILTLFGFLLTLFGITLIGRKINGLDDPNGSPYETFEQGTKKPVTTPYSVNFRIKYMVRGRWKKAWLNVVNPFRGNFIFGLPGSGKSYSVILEYIAQHIKKGFSMFVYDFKYPDLSTFAYNCYLRNKDVYKDLYGVEPYFCVINMKDPRYSMRCNPLDKRYIHDLTDANEKAQVIEKNVMKSEKGGFFEENAKKIWAACIMCLREFEDGKYCTFPHFIELVCSPQKKLMSLLSKYDDCRILVQDIINADKAGAADQAQGIFASASTPIVKMSTPIIYWIFGANNVDLNINNRKKPTILCVGNDPKRQNIYSTGISLITTELYVQINQPGQAPCDLIEDEYPTKKALGFDTVVATGRSNLLSAVAAAQDMDQVIRDLGKDNASALLSIIGNQFFGQMTGSHKREVSEMFGSHKVRQQSQTTGSSSDSISTSYHLEKRLPEDKLATMSQGTFAAIVTDGREKEKLDMKLFCAEIMIDESQRPNKKDGMWKEIPPFAWDAFHQEEVRKKVMDDKVGHILQYLFEDLMDEDRDKAAKDPYYTVHNQESGMNVCKRKYDEMSDKERDALLPKVLDRFQKREVDIVMKKNMALIRADIEDIFQRHGIRDDLPKKPAVPRRLNGGEKEAGFKKPPFPPEDEDDIKWKPL